MDRGLCGETERYPGGDLLFQASLVVQIEERGIDRRHVRQSTSRDQLAAGEGERRPGGDRPEIRRHIGSAQHQAHEPRRRERDRLHLGETARAFDQTY